MTNNIYFFFILCFINCKCREYTNDSIFSSYKDLTLGVHASEGGFARIDKNKIIVIYRKDPSFSHISNNSQIVSKISIDNGETWGGEKDVYNSPYDDRNLIIGNLYNGNIIIVFRRYDATSLTSVDSGYIISSDKGVTWGNYIKIKNTDGINNQPFGNLVVNKKECVFLICFDKGITKKYSSTDNFLSTPKETIIINDSTKILQEPFLVKLNNNREIILFRNGDGRHGQCSFYRL
jgi:hypothetical protein